MYMCLGASTFPFLNAAAKYLSTEFDTPMIVWARFFGHFLFMVLAFLPSRGWRVFITHQARIQGLRSLLLLGSTTLNFLALAHIPLTIANAIGFSAPFIVTALAVPLLGEHVGWRRWSAVAIGFLGVLIIVRPGAGHLHWAAALSFLATACSAIYQLLTRRFSTRDDPATTIIYTALVGTVASSLVVPFYWTMPTTWLSIGLFMLMGFCGGFGHFFVVKAFQYGEASVVAPYGYVQLIGTTLLGFWIFGDLPDRWAWLGTAIIMISSGYIAYREKVRRREGTRR